MAIFSLTQQFVTQMSTQMLLMPLGLKDEEKGIQILARHFLGGGVAIRCLGVGEAAVGCLGIKEPAFAGILGHREMDRAMSWSRGSLSVTNETYTGHLRAAATATTAMVTPTP